MSPPQPLGFALAVDRDSEVPLATQLTWKLRAAIGGGQLAAGAQLPGVRDVAAAAGVNVNTVRSVYGRLEEQGLISSQHGRGTFVDAGATREDVLAQIAARAAAEARDAGLDPRDVAAAVFVDGGPAPQGDARARRHRLRAEIAEAERQLAYLQAGGRSSEVLARARRPGQIMGAAELEAVRDELFARVAELRAERAESRRAAMRAREADAAPVLEPSRPNVWRNGGTWTRRLRSAGGGWPVSYES